VLIHLRDGEVGHHGIALVAAGSEQDRSPEVGECGEMLGPVIADGGVEDWAKKGVLADAGIETIDKSRDALIVERNGSGHNSSCTDRGG